MVEYDCARIERGFLALPFLLAAQFGLQTELLETRAKVVLQGCSFAATNGARVDCVLIEPRGVKGKFAGAVFQHGGGQTMMTYISEAAMLAESGVVSIIIDPPGRGRPNDMQRMNGAEIRDWIFEVAAAGSRAIDILLDRPDIDPARLAFVGHSYGANAAAIIGARGDLDAKLKFIAQADAVNFLPALKARAVLVQCAKFDMPDLMKSCPAVHDALRSKKQLEWYPTDHG